MSADHCTCDGEFCGAWPECRRYHRWWRHMMRAIATIRPESTSDAVVRPVRSDDDTKAAQRDSA